MQQLKLRPALENAIIVAEQEGKWDTICRLFIIEGDYEPKDAFQRVSAIIRATKGRDWELVAEWFESVSKDIKQITNTSAFGDLPKMTNEELFTIRLLLGFYYISCCQLILTIKEESRKSIVYEACKYFNQICSHNPINSENDVTATLAIINLNLAHGLSVIGSHNDAQKRFAKAAEFIENSINDNNDLYLAIQSRVHYFWGKYLVGSQKLNEAIHSLTVALNGFNEANKTDKRYNNILHQINILLGNSYLSLGDLLKAKTTLSKGIEIHESISENTSCDESLGLEHNNLAATYSRLEQWPKSIEHYKISLRIYDRASTLNPSNNFHTEQAFIRFQLGTSLLMAQKFDEAAVHIDSSIDYYSNPTHLSSHPDNRTYNLGILLHRKSQLLYAIYEYEKSLKINIKCTNLFEELLSAGSAIDYHIYIDALFYNFLINFKLSNYERSITKLTSTIPETIEHARNLDKEIYYSIVSVCISTITETTSKLLELNQTSISLDLASKSLNFFKSFSNSEEIELIYSYTYLELTLGQTLIHFNAYDEATNHFVNCEKLLNKIQEGFSLTEKQLDIINTFRAEVLNLCGISFSSKGKYRIAHQLQLEALKLLSELFQKTNILSLFEAEIYNNLGKSATQLSLLNDAINYFDKAIEIAKASIKQNQENAKEILCIALSSKAKAIAQNQELHLALEIYNEALLRTQGYINNKSEISLITCLNTYYEAAFFLFQYSNITGHDQIDQIIDLTETIWKHYKSKFSGIPSLLDQETNLETLCLLFRVNMMALTQKASSSQNDAFRTKFLFKALSHAEFYRSIRTMFFLHSKKPKLPKAPEELVENFLKARHSYLRAREASNSQLADSFEILRNDRISTFRSLRISSTQNVASKLWANHSSMNIWNQDIENNYAKSLTEIRKHDPYYSPDLPLTVTPYLDILKTSQDTAVVTIALGITNVVIYVSATNYVAHHKIKISESKRLVQALEDYLKIFQTSTDIKDYSSNSDYYSNKLISQIECSFNSLENISDILATPLTNLIPPEAAKLIISTDSAASTIPLHALYIAKGERLSDRYEISYTPSLLIYNHVKNYPVSATGKVTIAANPLKDLPFCSIEGSIKWPGFKTSRAFEDSVDINWVTENIRDAYVFQYSGHAKHDPQNQLESSLILAEGFQLTIRQCLQQLNLNNCRLAILNGCETGTSLRPLDFQRTKLNSGLDSMNSEALSLSTCFLILGAKCTLSTLWPVWDISSSLFNWKFSKHIQEQVAPATALQRTVFWIRDDIKTGSDLTDRILPEFIKSIGSQYASIASKAIEDHAKKFPDSPPFASPSHWAPYVISGCGWDD